MLIRKKPDIDSSEITPAPIYRNRRKWIAAAVAAAGAAAAIPIVRLLDDAPQAQAAIKLGPLGKSKFSTSEERTSYDAVTMYNNFYEFGFEKDDPARNAHTLKTRPWTVLVDGEVKKQRTFDIDQLLKLKNVFIACDALRNGRWWYPGLDIRCLRSSSRSNQLATRNTLSSPRCTIRSKCLDNGCRCSIGRTKRAFEWTKRCIR